MTGGSWMAYLGIGLVALGTSGALAVELVNRAGPLRTLWGKYELALDREVRFLHLKALSGPLIARRHLVVMLIGLAIVVALEEWVLLGLLVVGGYVPLLVLRGRRRERVQEIEKQLDGWLLVLANALKATPSLGEALASSSHIVREPIRDELEVCLKEIQLGTPIDRALASMAQRVGSQTVSGAVATLLVGRQTGGDLPAVLQESASTLREMERLEGVLRTKTAESKSQVWVLALVPFFLLAVIHYIDPHWLAPLTERAAGFLIVGVAGVFWFGAILLARRILSVDL